MQHFNAAMSPPEGIHFSHGTHLKAIIWPNAGIFLTGIIGTKFSEKLIEVHTFSFKKVHLKMLSWKWWPFCLGLKMLNLATYATVISSGLSQRTNHSLTEWFLACTWNPGLRSKPLLCVAIYNPRIQIIILKVWGTINYNISLSTFKNISDPLGSVFDAIT